MTHQKLGVDQEMIVGDSSPMKRTSNKENGILMESSSQKATKYRQLITGINEKIYSREISVLNEILI
jgi:hypothetical protein